MIVDDKDARVLFVKNLPYETTEEKVREHFPGVQSVRMPQNDDGQIKGWVTGNVLELKCVDSTYSSPGNLVNALAIHFCAATLQICGHLFHCHQVL